MMADATRSRRAQRDGTELRQLLARRRHRQFASLRRKPVPDPSVFEAVTRQMVESLSSEVRDVRQRVNQLMSVLIGAIVLEVLTRLIGG